MTEAAAIEETKDDLTADIRAAFEEVDSAVEAEVESTDTVVETSTQEPEQAPAEEGKAATETETETKAEKVETEVTAESKPPLDWTPKQKEEWSKIPPDIQKAIHEREKHINSTMMEVSEERRTAQNFNQMVSSYAPVFAAEGVSDPMQGIQGLINITAQLQTGSPAAKAERIAGLIDHYGVDIQTLANVIEGKGEVDPNAGANQVYDNRLANIENMLNSAYQQSNQQNYAQAGESIESFSADPANEFFHNVKGQMADYLDMASANGRNDVPLKEAYDFACGMNPEINSVLEQRKSTESLMQTQADIGAKQTAASSISGKLAGVVDDTEGLGLRETLERQFDKSVL